MAAEPGGSVAGAVHDRKAGADDGRSRRRPRRHCAAVVGGRSQRLCARSRPPVSDAICRHGTHPAHRAENGGAVSRLEETARHAGNPGDVSSSAVGLAHRRNDRLVLAGGGKIRPAGDVLRRADVALRAHRRTASAAYDDRRPSRRHRRHRKIGQIARRGRRDRGAGQIPERLGQIVDNAVLFGRNRTRSAT